MNSKTLCGLVIVSILWGQFLFAQDQRRDKGVMVEYKNEFMDSIRAEVEKFAKGEKESEPVFQMNFSGLDLPTSVDEFTRYWHNPPISQGRTGTCWCFSATSYFESEIYRLSKREIKLMEKPYYQKAEYKVPDNWWRSEEYYNLPLDEFMSTLKKTVREGYSPAIGGDVSEAGYESHAEVAVVPTFDIPSGYIDENARQFRFSNKSTTDDHAIHLAGYLEKDGADYWYLIKDSGSGSRNGKNPGYYFYHEDYVKLKIMNFLVHKSAVEDVLKKFE
jgi:hypothetical protein